jgi:hypothetical protein
MEDSALEQPQLTILVPSDDVEEVRQELVLRNIDVMQAEEIGFDGAALVALIVPLSTLTVHALVTLYKARITANKHISYESEGLKIKGVDEATLLKLVELRSRRRELP